MSDEALNRIASENLSRVDCPFCGGRLYTGHSENCLPAQAAALEAERLAMASLAALSAHESGIEQPHEDPGVDPRDPDPDRIGAPGKETTCRHVRYEIKPMGVVLCVDCGAELTADMVPWEFGGAPDKEQSAGEA